MKTYMDFIRLTGADALAPGEVRTVANPISLKPHIIIASLISGTARVAVDQIGAASIRVTNTSLVDPNETVLFVWYWQSVTGSQLGGYDTEIIHAGGGAAGETPTYLEPVKDILTNPPGPPPVDGDRYIVLSPGGGVWATHDDEIAEWDDTAVDWIFTAPVEGDLVVVEDVDAVYIYDPTNGWVLSLPLLHDLGDSARHSSNGRASHATVEANGTGGVRWVTPGENPPLYVDGARANDTGNGLSWATAKKSAEAAFDLTPNGGTQYIYCKGYSATAIAAIARRVLPYEGYKGSLRLVACDDWQEVAAGTVGAYTAGTGILVRDRLSAAWAGGYVAADSPDRRYWLETTDGTGQKWLHKVSRYDSVNATYEIRHQTGFTAAGGQAIRLLRPRTRLAFDATMHSAPFGSVAVTNVMLIGFDILCANVQDNLRNVQVGACYVDATANNGAFAFGEFGGSYVPVFDPTVYEVPAMFQNAYLSKSGIDDTPFEAWQVYPAAGVGNALPNCHLQLKSGGNVVVAGTYRSGVRLYGQGDLTYEAGALRYMNGSVADNDLYIRGCDANAALGVFEGCVVAMNFAEVAAVHAYGQLIVGGDNFMCRGTFTVYQTGKAQGSNNAQRIVALDNGGVAADSECLVELLGGTIDHLTFSGGWTLATPGNPLPATRIEGDGTNVRIVYNNLDRGDGPVNRVRKGARVRFDQISGDNTNAGVGGTNVGLLIEDPCAVEVTNAAIAIGANGGVKIGAAPAQAWPAPGNRVVDLAHLASLVTV